MEENYNQLGMFEMGETPFVGDLAANFGDQNSDGEVYDYYDDDANFNSAIVPGQYTPEQDQIIETCLSNIRSGGNVLIEYPSDEKRRLATLAAILQHIQDLTNENQNQVQQVPGSAKSSIPLLRQKIYCAASSFQEMEKIMEELKKFKNTGYLQNVTIAVLEHPSQLCRSCDNIYNLCSQRSFTTSEFRFIEENGVVHTVSDMKEKGHSEKRCAFRFNRDILEQANLIFCTQEFIITPDLRHKFHVSLENAVVVFDDGGNIENASYTAASIAITTARLTAAAGYFKTFADTLNQVNQNRQTESIELCNIADANIRLSGNLTSIARDINDQAHKLTGKGQSQPQPSTEEFLNILSKNGFDRNSTEEYISYIRLFLCNFETEHDINNSVKEKGVDIKLILSIQKLLSSISFVHQSISKNDFTFEISKYVPRGAQAANTFKIGYVNLSAVVHSIMNKGVSSLIIGSTCLRSVSLLRQELSPAAMFYEVEDAIMPEQTHTNCFFAYCNQGPNKVTFDYRHNNKGNPTVQNEAGEAILKIIQKIPKGVVVFLPSVQDLKDLIDYWKDADRQNADKSIWAQIMEIKYIFSELDCKRVEDAKSQLEKFRERCISPNRNGALLLALHRETVSEIMDFQKGEVQCFVALGISFNSPYVLNISAKKAYFLSQPNLTKDECNKINSLWYNAEALYNLYRKIAHCVGKEQSQLVALVFDTRMEEKATGIMGEILSPRWMRKEWKGYSDFEELIEKLAEF